MLSLNKQQLSRYGVGALAFLTLTMATIGALSLVWMQQQITRSAQHCRALEIELDQFERKNSFVSSKIAQVHNPEFLKMHASDRLAPPTKYQVVWANVHSGSDAFDPKGLQPYAVAFNLALLDAQKNKEDKVQ